MTTEFAVISTASLLWKSVAPALYLAKKATINCNRYGLTLFASDPDWTVVLVLEIERTKFNWFSCYKSFSFIVNLEEFYKMLSLATDEEIITIFGDTEEVAIGVSPDHFGPFGYRELISCETTLNEVDIRHLTFSSARYKYRMCAGIRRESFREAIAHLRRAAEVSVTITDKQVKFSGMNEEIIVDTPGEFGIETKPGSINPVELKFSLRHMFSYLSASEMTKGVWLYDSVDSGTMMLCPSGRICSSMYFFQTPPPPQD